MKLMYAFMMTWAALFATVNGTAQVTKIFMVRHADRDGNLDALKVPEGPARANELRRVLRDVGIDSIYSTNTTRTRETAQPLATALGLTTVLYSNSNTVIDSILKRNKNKEVLVVGHSNTVDSLIKRCGCTGIGNIPSTQFDNLYLVLVTRVKSGLLWIRKCELLKMKYGAVTN